MVSYADKGLCCLYSFCRGKAGFTAFFDSRTCLDNFVFLLFPPGTLIALLYSRV